MKDYNHNGRIDSEDELLLQEMVKDRVDESIEKHSFSDGPTVPQTMMLGYLAFIALHIMR